LLLLVGALVAYESRLELARIQLADFDPAVVEIAAQPSQLTGRDGGVLRRHVPDLLRRAGGSVVVVDVRPAHRLDNRRWGRCRLDRDGGGVARLAVRGVVRRGPGVLVNVSRWPCGAVPDGRGTWLRVTAVLCSR
jgi:hypothetical protein